MIRCLRTNSYSYISLSSIYPSRYITNSQYDQLPVGLIAQLVEHCTGIAEVMGSNPVQAWNFHIIFSTVSLRNFLSCLLHHCDALSLIKTSRVGRNDDITSGTRRKTMHDHLAEIERWRSQLITKQIEERSSQLLRNLRSYEKKGWKREKNQARTVFEPMTSAMPVQCDASYIYIYLITKQSLKFRRWTEIH